ncbi:MAG: DNA polymerase III subunit gamma/tau [bacterium]
MEKNNNLNLARKWRPKNFEQIIGQEIPVKMLLNSLYLDKLFPVYLFSGQRGCGKTSAARILGAAINCQSLTAFRQNPKENKAPCLKCESCNAMATGNHPDFIEIDAASHTGVENVRQILESCSYMPILGNKKIYLIDEAHMLSKAAFNAFLKILEEPPASALFILATTEKQKFPDTVLSRCFQVIFKAVHNKNLKLHIKNIAVEESVDIEDQAIDILIQETHGSVRDAINLLERVRFSETKISEQSILKILGKVSESEILDILEILINKNGKMLLDKMNSKTFENINPETLWSMLLETLRVTLWIKFKTTDLPSYFNDRQRLESLAAKMPTNRLNSIFQLLWSQEGIFLRTPNKKILLETILLQICEELNFPELEKPLKRNLQTAEQQKKPHFVSNEPIIKPEPVATNLSSNDSKIEPQAIESNNVESKQISFQTKDIDNNWLIFLNKIAQINNPFLSSMISQAEFIKFSTESKLVEISLLNSNAFTQETITENKKDWLPLLKELYPDTVGFEFIKKKDQIKPTVNLEKKIIKIENKPLTRPAQTQSAPQSPTFRPYKPNNYNTTPKPNLGALIDTSDKEKWPKANLIQKYFPGKIRRKVN